MSKPVSMYAPIPMVAGPVTLHPDVIEAIARDYGSGQIEPDFLPLYKETAGKLAGLMGTDDDVVLMTGEGMLALWGALKSCLKRGDAVLTVGTGVFGDGMADMAESMGCKVTKVSLPYDSTIGNGDSLAQIEAAIKRCRPVMITAVHCETPSGTLNPLAELGAMKQRLGVPLLCVDAVASLGGASIDAKAWNIDLVMAGSQKCLSAPPTMSIVSVSPTAWDIMANVNYQGYDAILPFKTIYKDGRCPYTPSWHGVAALHAAADALLREGLEAAFARHAIVAKQCREGLARIGVPVFPRPDAVSAPTVTAAMVPEKYTWPAWRQALRERGLIVSGSFGPMAGKVFRLGHMGTQADPILMQKALAAVEDALR
ncbi:Serine-pyruvate transaminase [uncultured delta proteobacterium]|uniref:Serine-pyruvate transaminase n=1 Tax=uncultured delta proteobacterium TaxID=34034 RepID=A0A212JHP3_9DELT|nr:Serine-pyruvate transaminase [uncultured delta proteobacterium]